ncbi:hypothetical protein ACLI09_02535 [Flavobacterium sp. RHBU_24]|uniref:hypothetical protein n=1 Tax=Flavobacterium sp. RHBU_24 TaxID=3391185 RepID=UPI003984C9C6
MDLNKITEETRPRVLSFLNAVKTHFSFLTDLGYKDIEERIATEYVVKNIVEIRYKNISLNQTINIHYEPNDINNKSVDLVNLFILKGDFMDKKLNFALYLNKYYPEIETKHLSYPKANEIQTFDEAMQITSAGYSYLVKDVGLSLVKGLEWEDGLIYTWSSAAKSLYSEQKRILGEDTEGNGNVSN